MKQPCDSEAWLRIVPCSQHLHQDILQSDVKPDVTSMKLSIPKPTKEMLPVRASVGVVTLLFNVPPRPAE